MFEIFARTIGAFLIGFGISRMFNGDTDTASWTLLIASILWMIAYWIVKYNT